MILWFPLTYNSTFAHCYTFTNFFLFPIFLFRVIFSVPCKIFGNSFQLSDIIKIALLSIFEYSIGLTYSYVWGLIIPELNSLLMLHIMRLLFALYKLFFIK